MEQFPYIVKIHMLIGGYNKVTDLVGMARTPEEAATSALAAEAHNELEDHPVLSTAFIDDDMVYRVHSAQQLSFDDYQIIKQHIEVF